VHMLQIWEQTHLLSGRLEPQEIQIIQEVLASSLKHLRPDVFPIFLLPLGTGLREPDLSFLQ
jgi:hypothetical protein